MKITLILILTLSINYLLLIDAHPTSITTFEQFKKIFNKKYKNFAEEMEAKKNFHDSLEFVRNNKGAKINHLSDLSLKVFENTRMINKDLYQKIKSSSQINANVKYCNIDDTNSKTLPESLDLRKLKHLSLIRDQGQCGSCWAFAGIASVESSYLAYKNQTINLSEQELVDCAANYGCHGDTIVNGLEYVQENGVVEENYYEYNGYENYCEPPDEPRHYIKNYCQIDSDIDLIKTALNTYKTAIAVIINIKNINAFRHYDGSYIISNDNGIIPHLHAVNIVGYGNEKGVDYWIVRNSWSENWGDNGYGYFVMDYNIMGIDNYPYIVLSV